MYLIIAKLDELNKKGDGLSWDIPEALKENIPASFQPYIKDREHVKILQEFDVNPAQLTQLAALSGIVQSAEEIKAKELDEEKGGDQR